MSSSLVERQLVVDGGCSPVLVGGAGEPGEAVVFVHGNPGAGSDWKPLMTRIAEFAKVVAPDMPGFGGADKDGEGDYTVASCAAHLAGVVDQLGLTRVHLVAHDFGGPFALTWAAANPGQIASITLINTGVLIDYRWHRLARLWRTPVIGELVQRATTAAVAQRLLRHDNPRLPELWVNRIAGHLMPRGTKRAVLRLYRSTNVKDIEALSAPLRQRDPEVLVVWGNRDVYLPFEQAERQLGVFPRAQIEILPGVGHWAWLEQPDRVAELVIPFLRDRVGKPTDSQQPTTTRTFV
jgi:pimeloyl-ACP methyl ester carboxylesterase